MRSPTRRAVLFSILILSGAPGVSTAQDCTDWSRPRVYGGGGAYVAGAAVTMDVRGGDWWRGESTGSFQVVWDGTPALGQDYLLRAYTAYQLSQVGGLAFRWACLSPRTSAWLGAGFAAAVIDQIKIPLPGLRFQGGVISVGLF